MAKRGRILRIAGNTMLTAGFLVAAYIVWLLLGTGLYTSRAQDGLRDDFNRRVAVEDTRPVALAGDAIAILKIPSIELDVMVVEGTAVEDLKKGPGHYTETAYPWEDEGTAGIAGHRTTYGAPFWALDEVEEDDRIILETEYGIFRYAVTEIREVSPGDTEVLEPTEHPTLVLTTCAPRFSAARRLIVFADRLN